MQSSETIESALNKIGLGKFHLILLLTLGFIHSCDSMEMLILAFLGPILSCDWRISVIEASFLTTAVFLGIISGSSLLGKFSDRFGRKTTLILTNSCLLYFGLFCAASPTVYWIIILRCLIGVCIGGNNSTIYSLLSEMAPVQYRGTLQVLLQFFWACGSIIITLLCFLVVHKYGWRLFLSLSTIPVIIVLVSLFWIYESPRYLLLRNQKSKALEIINKIAVINNAEIITELSNQPVLTSSFTDLIHSNYLLTTFFTSFIWLNAGLSYYSTILIVPIINGIPHQCLQNWKTFSQLPININDNKTIDNSCCFEMNWDSYKNMFISTVGEIAVIPISIILINYVGRKRTLSIYMLVILIGTFCLNFCMSSLALSAVLFVIRGAVKSLYNVIFIYCAEVYPTSVRCLSLGMGSSFSRIGAIISPFFVNILIAQYSFIGGTMLLVLSNAIGLGISLILPYETKDRELYQFADHTNEKSY